MYRTYDQWKLASPDDERHDDEHPGLYPEPYPDEHPEWFEEWLAAADKYLDREQS